MSLLNKLINGQASNQSLNGQTPNVPNFETSTLHNQYSTIGDPNASAVTPPNGVSTYAFIIREKCTRRRQVFE